MIVFALIIFGLATIRSVIPLSEPKNFTFVQVLLAVVHIVAFVILLNHFICS